jgi:uncharacterized protein YggU (UPF0235/DUF167 family)
MSTIKVKAFPSSKKEKVVNTGEHTFDMYVREPAQRNMANRRVKELVAHELGVEISSVQMRTGARSRTKTFSVNMKAY